MSTRPLAMVSVGNKRDTNNSSFVITKMMDETGYIKEVRFCTCIAASHIRTHTHTITNGRCHSGTSPPRV